MFTLDAVAKHATALPGVTVGMSWNHRTWMVGERGFAWERPFSKADLKRFGDTPPPSGDIIATIVENLDAKDAILALDLPGFFTIPHFNGYAAILIQLELARAADVRRAITDAHRVAALAKPKRKRRAPAK